MKAKTKRKIGSWTIRHQTNVNENYVNHYLPKSADKQCHWRETLIS